MATCSSDLLLVEAFDALAAHAAVLGDDGRIVATNAAWDLFAALNGGHPASVGVGADYVAICRRAGEPAIADGLVAVLSGERRMFEAEYPCPSPGEDRWFLLQAARLASGGAVLTHINITRRKELESRLAHLATHDELTGLANRAAAHGHAQRAIEKGVELAVLFCDLDGFKQVNDLLGHPTGDEVLSQVASRLARVTRTDDTLARVGGDEFVVIASPCDETRAHAIAERITSCFAEPFQVGRHELSLSCSVGFALGSSHSTVENLLERADVAMYAHKGRRPRPRSDS
jgi:diguanylate cyclase (GGDEF)-like protein